MPSSSPLLQGQQSLFNVLKAYALHDMEVGSAAVATAAAPPGVPPLPLGWHSRLALPASSHAEPPSCCCLLHCSQVGYCQGMAFVAGLLLFYVPEEPAFQLFCRLLRCGEQCVRE